MRMERWIEIDKHWVVVTGGGERGGNVILQVSIESNEMGIFITEYKCMLTRKPHSVRFWKSASTIRYLILGSMLRGPITLMKMFARQIIWIDSNFSCDELLWRIVHRTFDGHILSFRFLNNLKLGILQGKARQNLP